MSGKVFLCTAHRIKNIKILFGFLALSFPLAFAAFVYALDVTFDHAVVLLMGMMSMILLFITYYEGKQTIEALKRHRVEIASEHLIHVRDSKRELILYREIEHIEIIKTLKGNVKGICITTSKRKTSLIGYESLELLVDYLVGSKGIRISENSG